jgi:hypothetical protein
MVSLWPSTINSLNDSLTALHGSLGKLKAAKSIDIAEVIDQLKQAAECSRNLRALVLAEMPDATWQNREELDSLVLEIEKRVEARQREEMRARLNSLADELQRGTIVHRRSVRVTQMNQLKEAAVKELRAHAAQAKPVGLPGPEHDEWLDWGCNLKEPEDAEALRSLRNDFPHLDEFIANLEPEMWTKTVEATA